MLSVMEKSGFCVTSCEGVRSREEEDFLCSVLVIKALADYLRCTNQEASKRLPKNLWEFRENEFK